MTVFIRLIIATLLPLVAASAQDNIPEEIQHVETHGAIESYRLKSNDLRILLAPQPGLPVATVMVTYEVGSRNEAIGTTGATHILEHMMFKGTERFNPEKKNSYSIQMEQIGARSNATTWLDRTNYFATVPSQHVELAIELEADRMRNLRITEEDLSSEMTVVRNEYERGENNQVRTLLKEIFAAAFMAHPYGHPTIGWPSDIENTTTDKLQKFYDTFYWPENATLTVVGDFDRNEILTSIAQHFGQIPRPAASIPQVDTTEPPQIGPRHTTIHRAGQVGVVMTAFKVPEATHEDWPTLIVIDQILGASKTGRLYRALEDKGKASATFTFAPQLRDPGLFMLAAYLTPETGHEEVEAILNEEVERLISGGVTDEELKRAKSAIHAGIIYGRDGPHAIAGEINDAIASGDWKLFVDQPNEIQEVTKEQIQEVAAKYFKEKQQTTGWFVPEPKNTLARAKSNAFGPNYFRDPEVYGPHHNTDAPSSTVGSMNTVNFSDSMQTAEISGIEVVTIDLPTEGVVSFVGSIAAGDTMSPPDKPLLAGLTAEMLAKGTKSRDRFAIAELLDQLGAGMSFSSSPHSLNFSGKFLRPDAGPVIKILAEQLREPAFENEVFENLKSRQKAFLLSAIDNPDYRAGAMLARQLYPEWHPNYEIPLDQIIDSLDAAAIEDLVNFHHENYGPKSMRLVFAGDIDFEQLKAAIEIAFEGWSGGVDYPKIDDSPIANQADTSQIFIADKPSISVHAGYNTRLQRTDPDYLPFMVGNYILGGSFHSRLMSNIRKDRGLTYDIRSLHQGDILTKGNWKMTVSFAPALFDQGLSATRDILDEWHKNGVTPDEVAQAIETLSGSYLVNLSTTTRIASQVHSFMLRGYPATHIDAHPRKLKKLTPEDVNHAITKYFDPSKIRIVSAGSFENPSDEPKENTQKLTVRLDSPNPSWSIQMMEVYRVGDELITISELSAKEGMAAQVISTITDSVTIQGKEASSIKHYILGKTWDWGDTGEYHFIKSRKDLPASLKNGELIFSK